MTGDNIIKLPLVTRVGPDSIDPSERDLAHHIRSGRLDAEAIKALYERSGFCDWFSRQGFAVYKHGILNSAT